MSENTLLAKITADAETAVAEIKAAGEKEVQLIQQQTEAQLKELREAQRMAQQKRSEHLELVALSRAKQEGSIALQTAKRKQIDTLFDELHTELIEQPAAAYVTFFAKRAKLVLGDDVVTGVSVEMPPNREAETKQILETLGLSGTLTATSTITAGFMLYTDAGVYDVTLERLLTDRRSELEMAMVNHVME